MGGGLKLILTALLAAAAASAATLAWRPPTLLPPASVTETVVAPTPDVLLAIQNLARLESVTFHMERVVDLADHQKRVFGLVEAKDAILLVAVGDVVAGCDLSKVQREDIDADFAHRRISVRLPAPTVFSTDLDDKATHVYTRATDTLATRHEDLEQRARQEARRSMQKAAEDAGILDRAHGSAEAALRGLLSATGFEEISITFAN